MKEIVNVPDQHPSKCLLFDKGDLCVVLPRWGRAAFGIGANYVARDDIPPVIPLNRGSLGAGRTMMCAGGASFGFQYAGQDHGFGAKLLMTISGREYCTQSSSKLVAPGKQHSFNPQSFRGASRLRYLTTVASALQGF